MVFKDKNELNKYMLNNYKNGAYLIIDFNGVLKPIWFFEYDNHYFETSMVIYKYKISHEELIQFVKDRYYKKAFKYGLKYEEGMYIDGIHYEIEDYQCLPYIEFPINVHSIIKTEQECLRWVLKNNKIQGEKNEII